MIYSSLLRINKTEGSDYVSISNLSGWGPSPATLDESALDGLVAKRFEYLQKV